MNLIKYVQLLVLGLVIAMAVSLKVVWNKNQELKEQNLLLETQNNINKNNINLLNDLLSAEQDTRIKAQNALSNLKKEVPNDVYNQKLPTSIQTVIDNFNRSVLIK